MIATIVYLIHCHMNYYDLVKCEVVDNSSLGKVRKSEFKVYVVSVRSSKNLNL